MAEHPAPRSGKASTVCRVDEDLDPTLPELTGAAGVIGVTVRAHDSNELVDRAAGVLDRGRDPRHGAGVPAVDQRQLGLQDQMRLDPSERDRLDVADRMPPALA
jgi:hypothetical protein